MRKSIVTIVGLCFLASASAAETVKGADAAKLTESEAAYIYLQANAFEVERRDLASPAAPRQKSCSMPKWWPKIMVPSSRPSWDSCGATLQANGSF